MYRRAEETCRRAEEPCPRIGVSACRREVSSVPDRHAPVFDVRASERDESTSLFRERDPLVAGNFLGRSITRVTWLTAF